MCIRDSGKSVVYYAMMASDDEMALMDALAGQNADMGEVTRVLMETVNDLIVPQVDAYTKQESDSKYATIKTTSLTCLGAV